MNGAEEMKEKFKKRTENKINENRDIKYLSDFYYFVKIKPKATTVYNYINYVIRFMRFNNITDPSDIRLLHYTKYMASIDNETQSYQIAVYHALQKYSKFLSVNKICDDYMEAIERPSFFEKQETKVKRENGYLTEQEASKILNSIIVNINNAWQVRDYAIIILFLTSGIRCSALCNLDIKDIDFDNHTIIVTEKRSTIREIVVPTQTIDAIKNWLVYRNSMVDNNEPSLFISNRKTRLDNRSVYRIANKYGNIEGKRIHPHTFRATYGTTLYRRTNDLYFVQKNMGHSNPRTTELYIRGEDASIKEKSSMIMNEVLNDIL